VAIKFMAAELIASLKIILSKCNFSLEGHVEDPFKEEREKEKN
jgi:hypothetical protein